MKTRAMQLRERHRRILSWSLGAAVMLHVLAVVLWPGFQVDPDSGWTVQSATFSEGDGEPLYVDLALGPPAIFREDGTLALEPPHRRLETSHVLPLPAGCASPDQQHILADLHGRVRLHVHASGRADVVELVEGTGSTCGDGVMTAVAGALLYRWLPNPEFPAPVDLIQPITLSQGGD